MNKFHSNSTSAHNIPTSWYNTQIESFKNSWKIFSENIH